MVETKVIKKISPSYVTRHESAEKEEIKRKIKKEKDEKIRAEEEKKRGKRITDQYEIQRLYEDQNEKIERALGGKEKIEKNLKEKGFHFYSSSYFYAIDNCIWNGGNLVIREDARPFSERGLFLDTLDSDNSPLLTMPAVALSEDGGIDWKIYSTLDVGGDGDFRTPLISSIVFVNKNTGFVSLFWEYDRIGILSRSSSYIYKTENGGKNWKMVLRIEKHDYKEPSGDMLGIANKIVRIEATGEQHIVAILFSMSDFSSFMADGLDRTIESRDGGKNWTYINGNGVRAAKSCAEDLIWKKEKGEIIPQF
ncbi:MAG: hypothetical protein HYT36_01410 [Candidatus Staskawiczbacteria bacterium]|nr:hypothetical protein [Candidatus Staskawiczbacteria bacterium]